MSDETHAANVRRHRIQDLTYALSIAFPHAAAAYGVRLSGIEVDINEHNDFWRLVATHIVDADPQGGTQP